MYLIKVNLTSIEFFNKFFRKNLPYSRSWKEALKGIFIYFLKNLEK
jgi:hypothetical protein